MNLKRTIRYCWLRFKRLQGDPRKLAWGMSLGVFIGVTPTFPFHTFMALALAPILRVSPVTAYLGIWICNPLTMAPLYLAAYEVGRLVLFQGQPLCLPKTFDFHSVINMCWEGGVALQVGGLIIAIPPAIAAYFVTLWVVKRYRQHKARRSAGVDPFPQNPSEASGPET